MTATNEPILSRLERLDVLMGYLEEMKGMNKSGYSTPSSGITTTTNGGNSSVNSSPRSLEKHCRPLSTVILETQLKGNLVDRLIMLENRVLKLSLQIEEEIEGEKKMKEEEERKRRRRKKHALKNLLKTCVGGETKTNG